MIKFNLKEILEQKGKTRYWLSKQTNIDSNTLSKIYNSTSTKINIETINKICSTLDCDLHDLITYTRP